MNKAQDSSLKNHKNKRYYLIMAEEPFQFIKSVAVLIMPLVAGIIALLSVIKVNALADCLQHWSFC